MFNLGLMMLIIICNLYLTISKVQHCLSKKSKMWIGRLGDEELAFIKRFILASGSLKELDHAYGVSYPTVRTRLDRLIDKISLWDSTEITSDFEKFARSLYVESHIDLATLKELIAAHRKEMDE